MRPAFIVAIIVAVFLIVPAAAAQASGQGAVEAAKGAAAPGPCEVMYGKPSSYAQLVGWYKSLEANYSDYIEVFKANELYHTGIIQGGYDDYYVRVTNESRGFYKPEAFFMGGPHGDETAGTVSMYWFCDWLMRCAFDPAYYDLNTPYLRWLLDNREIYLEVSHNPSGFDHKERADANGTDLNREADYDGPGDGAPGIFLSCQGKTLREFMNHHQIRTACDFHGGARMLLYPWGNTHKSITGKSPISKREYTYAPPDFYYYDASSLRLGTYMGKAGSYGGELTYMNTGTTPNVVGYNVSGGMMLWAYGADTASDPAEAPFVKHTPNPGAGAMWVTPEISPHKNPDVGEFGGDLVAGYGIDVRRFILHQTDLAQPYIQWQDDSVKDGSACYPGQNVTFRWQVGGCMAVDHTSMQWGDSPDPANISQHATKDYDQNAGKWTGGTAWDGARDGEIVSPATYEETVTLPAVDGDYYFVAKAQVDQRYMETLAPQEYGANHTYLRILKERLNDGWTETINGTDGNESMSGHTWWYSKVIHIGVNKAYAPILEIFLDDPNGGEKWYTGGNYEINYTIMNGTPDYKIDIYLSLDGGFTWTTPPIVKGNTTSSAGPGSYLWAVPSSLPNCTTCRIKTMVQDYKTDVDGDMSDANFEIVHASGPPEVLPEVKLLSPNGGEKWYVGDAYRINWTLGNASPPYSVSLFLSTDGGNSYPFVVVQDIIQNGTGPGSYDWIIPSSCPLSQTCRIRAEIKDNNSKPGKDSSDGNFELASRTPPQGGKLEVKLLSPNGGETLNANGSYDITWTSANGTPPIAITLKYSYTGAEGNFEFIQTSLPNSGSYSWTVPPTLSTSCFVKITAFDKKFNKSEDTSDSAFAIRYVTPPPQKDGRISGTVTDSASHQAIRGVTVSLYLGGYSTVIASTTTAGDGNYSFESITEGTYDLRFSCAKYAMRTISSVWVDSSSTTYRDLAMVKTPAPAGPTTTVTEKPVLGVGYECLFFAFLGFFILLGAAGASMYNSRKLKEEEEFYRNVFPAPRGTRALQEYLMKYPHLPLEQQPPKRY